MDDITKELLKDVRSINNQVTELVKQGAINTSVLIEHERRSRLLEERVQPLEADYAFRAKLYTALAAALAAISTTVALYKSLK